jgi:hypothetical protein
MKKISPHDAFGYILFGVLLIGFFGLSPLESSIALDEHNETYIKSEYNKFNYILIFLGCVICLLTIINYVLHRWVFIDDIDDG